MSDNGRIILYDTTLRDGMAREGVTLSVNDKIKIAHALDDFGIDYIEGGYPHSNPKELEFFRRMTAAPLARARLTAFGSTRRKDTAPGDDDNLRSLLDAKTPAVCIFGKTSEFQVKVALATTPAENLAMIRDSVAFLREAGREVIYDAEHFFDGYKQDADYAKQTLAAARDAGAAFLVLCDTNGGTTPGEIERVVRDLSAAGFANLGIHTHNDIECAVANSLVAVEAGCVMVQGTMNGLGERTGNANLCSIIPTLELKMNRPCLPQGRLARLVELSHFVSETANLQHNPYQAYVGKSAFAHKGGAHGSAVSRDPSTYEHIDPSLVGNERKLVVSEIAGRSMIMDRAEKLGITFTPDQLKHLLARIKELEYQGYTFEAADGSLALLLMEEAGVRRRFFEVEGYHVHLHRRSRTDGLVDATIKIKVGDKRFVTAAEGNGPVNALDGALRRCVEEIYEETKQIELLDYKVRVIEGSHGTAAVTRVLIESGDGHETWGTIGVHENIIKASWDALYDAIEYGLHRLRPAQNA
ncbi:citramalate synthase [bacterium]|nr:citramalate synthase [bacterium]